MYQVSAADLISIILTAVGLGMALAVILFLVLEISVGKPERKRLGELNRELGRVEARNEAMK